MRARAFTLIELALVVGIIGLLAAMLATDFRPYYFRAKTTEARATLDAIANSELTYFRDHGKYIACAPSADAPPRGVTGVFDATRPGWKELGYRADGPARYQYQVKLVPSGFEAIAHGDLNGDGLASTFVLHGDRLNLTVTQELE